MKLVKITTAYPAYLKKFYAERPGLSDKTYREQKSALDYDGFGWPDFWQYALEPLGYEVTEWLTNAKSLQTSWANEHGVKYRENDWLLDIAKAQILHEKPDILFVVDYATFTYAWLKELLEKCPSIKLVLGWCGAPFIDDSVFKAYDVTLSCIPELVERFRAMGHKSEHMHHAFDPRILERLDLKQIPYIDFSFIGQIVRSNEFHLERERILEQMISKVDVQIFSPSAEFDVMDDLKALAKDGLYETVKVLKTIGFTETVLTHVPIFRKAATWTSKPKHPVSPKLKPFMQPGVFGLEMFQTLRNSKATFNSHIDISPRFASNMRLFEAAGVGACLVTDWKENIHELFEIDKEVITYKSAEECVEKVKWLIDHDAAREAIAKAGQTRAMKDHTFARRAVELDEIIRRELKV
ncbi:MAG: CgeB family protein [Eubacteriales bacterium]